MIFVNLVLKVAEFFLFLKKQPNSNNMIVTIVHVWVKPEHADAFIEATLDNHRHSIAEPGNRRFDFLRDANDPNKFTLYEAYETQEAVLAHKETAHYPPVAGNGSGLDGPKPPGSAP
jgi:autoinducer 2-degrading protein